jgi:RNA-directed DNA polymerase
MNFKINTAKTKLMTPGNRQTVTGIVVNEKPQVVFHKRNELRQAMYYIQKFGIDEHQNTEKLTKELFGTPARKNNFCFADQPKRH